jgi:hypothetical protein
MPELKRITRDPAIMGGKPCIRGMRVTVGTVVGLVAAGRTHRKRHPPSEDASETAWRQTLAQTERRCYRSVSERITSPG